MPNGGKGHFAALGVSILKVGFLVSCRSNNQRQLLHTVEKAVPRTAQTTDGTASLAEAFLTAPLRGG